MALSQTTIQFLVRNIKALHSARRLEDILPLWEALTITMNDAQFELAVTKLRMSADNIKIARLFLVEGKTAIELNKEHGVSASRLSKVLKRVAENHQKQLDALNLVSSEYTLDKKTAKLVRELETSKINEAKLRYGNPIRKTKSKKKQPAKK